MPDRIQLKRTKGWKMPANDRFKSRPKESPLSRVRREREIDLAYSRLCNEGAKIAAWRASMAETVGWQYLLSPKLPSANVIFAAASKLRGRYRA